MADDFNGTRERPAARGRLAPLPPLRPGVVALMSGGLDSAVMAGLAVDRGDTILPLYIRQGFVWEDEEEAAVRAFLRSLSPRSPASILPLRVSALPVPGDFPQRWALDADRPAPDASSPDEAVYLPGRNLALLTQAAMAAYAHGFGRIQMGSLSGNPFPDATPEFFRAFERTVLEAMRWTIRVETPLRTLTKTEALELGLPYRLERTLSCIRPSGGAHCGRCNKCAERRLAFTRAGLPDPTRYLAS